MKCRVHWALHYGGTGLMKFFLGRQVIPAIEEPLMYCCSVYEAKRVWCRKKLLDYTLKVVIM